MYYLKRVGFYEALKVGLNHLKVNDLSRLQFLVIQKTSISAALPLLFL
jgi:hypothetical protein